MSNFDHFKSNSKILQLYKFGIFGAKIQIFTALENLNNVDYH